MKITNGPGDAETLVDVLRLRAERQPDRLAYAFLPEGKEPDGEEAEERLTYAELHTRASSLAAHLRDLGAQGGRALLLYPTGLDYVTAFFGCLCAGTVAVPAYPPRPNRPMPRIHSIVADAGATVALTTSRILSGLERRIADLPDLKALAWRATDMGGDAAVPASARHAPHDRKIRRADLAFLQYTSGSTASPKGVMVSHGNLMHNEELIRRACGHSGETPFVSWLPLYHDLGLIGNLLQALYVGAPCTLMTPVSFLKSPIRWLDAVSRRRAYCSGGPNFAYDLAVRKTTPEQRQGLDLSSWRVAFNGAEPVRPETLERFARTFSPYGFRSDALFPCYGLAETTLIVSGGSPEAPAVSRRFDTRELGRDRAVEAADGEAGRDLVGCGRPLGDLEVAIVHPETLARLPAQEIGEVWVAGGSVAQGYWNRPEATAETFGARTADGSGPYLRTGDLGFLAGDGELFITGRSKDLLILRGGNHYPQDVERTVEGSHPALVPGAAAAFAVEAGGEERLVVVQEVQRTERRADVREIAAAVRAAVAAEHELPLYALVLIRPGTIPKTTSGKIQRGRCREELLAGGLAVVSEWWEAPLPAAEASAPADVERWIVSLLAATTGVATEEIDPRLPVAHYGLDSLRAIELLHAIETGTGAAPSLESLWGGLTVAGLAAEAAAALGAEAVPESEDSVPESGDHPLTPGQSALWLLDRLEPGNAAYNIASAAEIAGGVDVRALRAAFQGLIDRHPALRTTFPAVGGAPVARVHPAAEADFAEVEAGPAGDEELRSRLAAEAERPFDLERGPLFSIRLFARGERPTVLLLVVHHIVADLWSLAVLVRDLGALYRAALAGDDAPLPDLPLTYAAHARRERASLAGPVGERLFAFWREALAGELPPLDLATDRPRPPVQTYRGEAEKVALPPALAPAVRELGRAAGASPFMTLAAAFAALLHRYTGMGTIALGTPTAGRRRAALADLVGYFVNPVVLRADLSGDPGFGELLRRVRAVALAASEHQDLPFPALVERLDPERDPSRSPLFQAMFAYQGIPAAADPALAAFALGEEGVEIEAGGLRLRHLPLPQRMAQFELTLSMGEVGGAFAGTLDYNTDLFDRTTAVRLTRNLEVFLTAAAADPARPLADLPLLTEGEREQVVRTWNASRAVRGEIPVHRMFAERAAAAPEATAVVFRGERLSYGDLDRRAGQLSGRLLALGIGPERVVGLSAERSPDLIAGILAILRTGAGYLPLDPETPPERRAFVLRDAGAAALVTDQTSNLPANLPVLGIRADGAEGAEGAEILPDPSNLACVLYTSGSTGEPKGVLLEHRHLTALVESFAASYAPGPGDAILPLTSVASASFVGEILPLLATGGTVVLPGKEEMLAAPAILELAARHGVTILSTVPSLLALLNAAADELPRLRLLLSGGEALAPGDVDRLLGRATIVNGYGLTETTVCSTVHVLGPEDLEGGRLLPIGRPLANHRVYVLDGNLTPRPIGCAGEVFIAGEGVARGFVGRPAETALRFLPDPFAAGERMLRTGDLARWRSDGSSLEYLGRLDQQVKIRGHRIELGEIEAALGRHPALREGAVALRELAGEMRLVAWVVPRQGETVRASDLLAFLRERIPAPMVPAAVAAVPALPLSANGKVDTAALPTPERPGAAVGEGSQAAPRSEIERAIATVWQEALGVPRVGVHDNFFDLGGHSLLMAKVHARLLEALPGGMGRELSLIDLFKHPTVAALARSLAGEPETVAPAPRPAAPLPPGERVEIAVIGMSGRFPGARNPEELWQNLVQGTESITRFTDEELLAAGVPRSLVDNPDYVKAKGILGGVDLFDAAFFGLSPRGAELTDPQHRVFLECAWEALEAAGYDAGRYPGRIGVFAGQSMNTYWLNNLYHHIDLVASLDSLQAAIGNDKDSLTTEVSYRLDLRGPSVLVQSSSSTSLTAVHYACQSLKSGECDMALAGGVSIHLPEVSGYLYHEGGTTDPEGHCRTFDAEAKGFVSGHGAGVVVLKRLADALADGDDVWAVLKGSACNNDGSHKVSYMAPSVDGHAEVVRRAQEAAGVTPDTVTYVEAHGTGTLLGDPIEVAALAQAFRAGTDRKGFCALGSLKTNIGHLDTAAGIAGLIKTVLCLRHRTLPPILHFRSPNPKIDFAGSPFFVNDRLRPWETPDGVPRRAGVSSLGMGGTNTHVVLEEAPPPTAAPASGRPLSLFVISARTETALETLTDAMAEHLRSMSEASLPDAAWTLQAGRKLFPFRRAVVAATPHEAAGLLVARDPERVHTVAEEARERPVAFLLSGQGAQYPGMGRGLYETEPVFRQEIDRAADLLRPHLGFDLRQALYPALSPEDDAQEGTETAAERLRQTAVAQPALFAVEHALARLLMSWGIRPDALLGHSVGEITAACLAGVFSLEDALGFVAVRGRLMQAMPPGSMLAVPLPEPEAAALAAAHGAELAAINRPGLTVLSGPAEAIAAAAAELAARGIEGRPLVTSHAFHSPMMDPVMPELRAAAARCALQPPRLPFLSNLTGTWIRAEEATDPEYWARQMRGTVRFAAGVGELLAEPGRVLVEVGPGNALATAARQHPGRDAAQLVLTTLRHARERRDDLALLLESLGRLWASGAVIDWGRFHAGAPRRRTALPTHPFERRRFWIEPRKVGKGEAKRGPASDLADWFHLPVWKQAGRLLPDGFDAAGAARESWLLLADRGGLGTLLADRLLAAGAAVAVAPAGEDPAALFARLAGEGTSPTRIVHLGSLDAATAEEAVELGFLSLLALARAASARGLKARIIAVSSGVQEVTGDEELNPARATLLGAVHVIPREMPDLGCRSVDLPDSSDAWAGRLLAEIASAADDPVVALRGTHRFTRGFEPVRLEKGEGAERLVDGGVYLVTGGLGGIGGAVALHLARTRRAKLVLTSRSGLPPQGFVRELEALGAEVLVGAADVSDRAAMESVLHAARERFGPIDGVFHAAGVPGGGLIERRTRAESLAVLAPKVLGTLVLYDLLAAEPPGFLVLFSSVTSLLSQPGQADYAAANAFLDAYAGAAAARGGPFTLAVNWDAWREVGMAAKTAVPEALRAWREESLRQGLSPAEGIEALERALASPHSQIVVSRKDFAEEVSESFASRPLDELERLAAPEPSAHARPALGSAYVAPRGEAEERIAALWQEILGIDRVGAHDNFFELGGNSLVGLKVISRLKAEFGAEISAVHLFEGPTVAALARLLAPGDPAEQESSLQEIYNERRSRGALRREKLRRLKG
ncbi:MAG TPA: amino acid adenylation domain-containing protein [Thermoanaerobaculia bacterium]|nr:amino acid adenylation domain-containing protein [Thermoanaerobaculia bacterium]